jgi:hypothetical protein
MAAPSKKWRNNNEPANKAIGGVSRLSDVIAGQAAGLQPLAAVRQNAT